MNAQTVQPITIIYTEISQDTIAMQQAFHANMTLEPSRQVNKNDSHGYDDELSTQSSNRSSTIQRRSRTQGTNVLNMQGTLSL